ncbi:MAG TPA: class I adenylate-forming enzyme family protein, partial [Methylomirabilota bacterium]|nr:class I adenylate-forming enzyme family protein [Methylomirabilota bacterium]
MKTIHELLHTAVSRYGARVALIEPVDDGGMVTLTYNDLLERAHGFAGALHELGLQKGDRLLLWSASRIDWMAAFLGAMLIGAVVVPLDINSKEDFLSKIEQSTEAKYLITSQKQYSGLKQPHAPLIDIDALPLSRLDMAALPEINSD